MLDIFSLPQMSSWQNILLWIFRVIGATTFIFWPGVLIAGVMGAAGYAAKETLWTSIFRVLCLVSILYPLVFVLIWKWADSFKVSNPGWALFTTALPALLVYGAIGYYQVDGILKSQNVKKQNAELILQIKNSLTKQDYNKAFDLFLNPDRHSEAYLLEESKNPGFDFKALLIETLEAKSPSQALVEKILDYAQPSIEGVTSVHRAYLNPKSSIDSVDESAEVLALVLEWKQKGLQLSNLSRGHQWIWDHLDLYQNKIRSRPAAEAIKKENLLLAATLNFYGDSEKMKELLEKYPSELLNHQGEVFGTPLKALLMNECLKPYKENRNRIRLLHEQGARLHSSEENPENLKLLKSILDEKL